MKSEQQTEIKKKLLERKLLDAGQAKTQPELSPDDLDHHAPLAAAPEHSTAQKLRRSSVQRMQRLLGNAYVARKLRGATAAPELQRHADHHSPEAEQESVEDRAQMAEPGTIARIVQRHPEGAGLSIDQDAVIAELDEPAPTDQATQAGPSGDMTAETSQTETTEQPSSEDQATQAGPSQDMTAETSQTETTEQPSDETVPAAQPTSSGATPAPASSQAMTLTRAQQILQATYGNVHQIVPGNIVLLNDNAAIWAAYDRVALGRPNPRTGSPWKNGDAQQAYPRGLNGFQDGGTVYVNSQTTSPTTTAHEMMHLNTGAGFRSSMGEVLNEGSTQYLTVRALRAANVVLPAALPYADEMDLADALANFVGVDTLVQAYFNGGTAVNLLIGRVDVGQGAGTFATFRQLAEARDYAGAKALLKTGGGTQQEVKPVKDTDTVTV